MPVSHSVVGFTTDSTSYSPTTQPQQPIVSKSERREAEAGAAAGEQGEPGDAGSSGAVQALLQREGLGRRVAEDTQNDGKHHTVSPKTQRRGEGHGEALAAMTIPKC